MTATDLDRALARLAADIEPPRVPVSDDLARGRRRLLRRRLAVAGAAAVTTGILGGIALLGQGTPQTVPDPADRTPTPEVTDPNDDAGAPTQALPSLDDRQSSYAATLRAWNDALAAHLDPQREHLAPYTRATANQQTSGGPDGLQSLGSRYGWSNAGEEGRGMLEVTVSRGRASVWPCRTGEGGVTCRDAEGPNGEAARVGTSGAITTVQLEQADGDVVTLTLNLLFGNNSLVPLSGADVTPAQLLEAAADDTLELPQPPPAADIDPTLLDEAIRADLAPPGLEFVGFVGGDRPLVSEGGFFDGQRQVAVVTVDAFPVSAGYGLPAGCDRKAFTRCERREVEGQQVFLGWLDQEFFPGVQVVLAGPQHVVRAQWEQSGDGGAEADVDRLVDFVTDPRWQR